MEKINAKDLENFVDVAGDTIELGDYVIEVKPYLPIIDMLGFVDSVANSCFGSDTDEYMPEIKDYAIRREVFNRYTNIELPSDVTEEYDFIYKFSGLYFDILNIIDNSQFDVMCRAIDNKIVAALQVNANSMKKQMDELYYSFDRLVKDVTKKFDGISEDDIKNLTSAINNGEFDDDKLLEKFVKNKERK